MNAANMYYIIDQIILIYTHIYTCKLICQLYILSLLTHRSLLAFHSSLFSLSFQFNFEWLNNDGFRSLRSSQTFARLACSSHRRSVSIRSYSQYSNTHTYILHGNPMNYVLACKCVCVTCKRFLNVKLITVLWVWLNSQNLIRSDMDLS